MLNPQVKDEWLNRLRSGKYAQGYSYLHANNEYCCLGVLCEIAVDRLFDAPPIIPTSEHHNAFAVIGYRDTDIGKTGVGFPVDTVRDWAGLTDEEKLNVANMNDNGFNFEQIADYIEAQL